MKNFRILTILALVALAATGAQAFDLVTSAAVEVVEGVVVTETQGMDFGKVADHTGTLVLSTNPATPMIDGLKISFDDTGYGPAIFSIESIVGAALSAAFADDASGDGLTLSDWTISVDGGGSDETDLVAIVQAAGTDTWNVGATLTVDAATASIGVASVGYTMTVTLD